MGQQQPTTDVSIDDISVDIANTQSGDVDPSDVPGEIASITRGLGGEQPPTGDPTARPPTVLTLAPNTTWLDNARSVADETLGSSDGSQSQAFVVTSPPVIDETVWVDEAPTLSDGRRRSLSAAETPATEEVTAPDGSLQLFWVAWSRVADFLDSGEDERQPASGDESHGGSRLLAVGSPGAVLLSALGSILAAGLLPDRIRIHWTLGLGSYYGPEFAPTVFVLTVFPVMIGVTALGAYWGASRLRHSDEFATFRPF